MPTFIRYANCTVTGQLAEASLALSEVITDRTLLTLDLANNIAALIPNLDTNLRAPLRRELESILAAPLDDVMTAICLPPASTLPQVEARLRRRENLHVVNGRVLLPGDLDISCFRELVRLIGTYAAASAKLGTISSGSFTFLVTHAQTTVVPATLCSAATTDTTEVLLGIDIPVQQILSSRRDLTFVDLKIYIFWKDIIQADTTNVNRLIALGLPADYVPLVMTDTDQDNVVTCVIRDVERLSSIGSLYGVDIERVVLEGPNSLSLYPTTDEVIAAVTSAVTRRTPGSRTECSTVDLTDPALDVLVAVDLDTTLNIRNNLIDCGLTSDSAALAAISGILDRILTTIRTVLENIRSTQMYLMELAGLLSSVQNLFAGDTISLLACLTRGITGAGTAMLRPHLNNITVYLQTALDDFDVTITATQRFYGMFSTLLCLFGNLLSAICSENFNQIPGLQCLNLTLSDFGFSPPECFSSTCYDMSAIVSMVNGAVGTAIGNLTSFKELYQSLVATMASAIGTSVEAVTLSTSSSSQYRAMARGDTSPPSPVCNPLQAELFFGQLIRSLGSAYESTPFRPVLP
jgi:hypothetical protein